MKVTNKHIMQALQQLPILPEIVKEINYFQNSSSEEDDYFFQLMQQSSISSSKILKTVNTPPFKVDNYIESSTKAVQFLGTELACALAIYENVKNAFYIDLEPYGSNVLEYDLLILYKVKTLLKYIDSSNQAQKYNLVVSMLLHNIGKFIIAKVIKKQNQLNEFYSAITQNSDHCAVEKEFVDITASQLSAVILKQWKFHNDIVKTVYFLDQPNTQNSLLVGLNSIKQLYNLHAPLSDASKANAYAQLQNQPQNQEKLKKITQELQESFFSEYERCRT